MTIRKNIENMRSVMQDKNLNACIIPSADPHASEYLAEHWKARAFFSGFTGSAGTLVVSATNAGVWTDSRYHLQAEEELADTGITLFRAGDPNTVSMEEWLSENLEKGDIVCAQEELFAVNDLIELHKKLASSGISLETEIDLIGLAWKNRHALPLTPVFIHEVEYAGLDTNKKLEQVRSAMQSKETEALILNTLDEIAWLLNIRGNDVTYNPVSIAYAVIETKSAYLFIDDKKLDKAVSTYLESYGIEIRPYKDIYNYLELKKESNIWIDPKKANFALYRIAAENNNIKLESSPISNFKSIKNETEIAGIKKAMIKDGIALTRFFIWFENCLAQDLLLTEIELGEKLKEYRAKQELFFGESFAPIVGYKEHGAIVHYSANPKTNNTITKDGLLLIDSGAQFLHGTTDITRTVSLGNTSTQEKKDFTLVLKGHIALAQAKFPEGTCGYQLDSLARQFLWQEGLNYGHGTGHGVGCFLCVHEGPQGIRPDTNATPLKAGMVISNEPGLYRANEYGIRIENLILVCESKNQSKENFFCFETLTLFPLDKNAIDNSLLTENELKWLNNYHQRVFENLSPYLTTEEITWLAEKCQAI